MMKAKLPEHVAEGNLCNKKPSGIPVMDSWYLHRDTNSLSCFMLKKKNPLEIPNVSDNPIGYFPTPYPPPPFTPKGFT